MGDCGGALFKQGILLNAGFPQDDCGDHGFNLRANGTVRRARQKSSQNAAQLSIRLERGTRWKTALYRNVRALDFQPGEDRDEAIRNAENLLLEKRIVSVGVLVVLTWGEPMGQTGGTNTMKIVCVGASKAHQ